MAKRKNAAAVALVKRRWAKTTKAERSETARDLNKARWANVDPAARKAAASAAAKARWAKRRAEKEAEE